MRLEGLGRIINDAPNNAFVGDLIIRVLPHWEIPDGSSPMYQLMESFGYISKDYGQITVPEGFLTDFGSVPTFAKPIVDNDDPDLLYGAVIHDYLYKNHGVIHVGGTFALELTRYQADCVLREAMLSAGAPVFKAWLVFRAVRIGGGSWE